MRRLIIGLVLLAFVTPLRADWQKATDSTALKEKSGFGGICGVLVDRKTGHVLINVSDKGLYRSTNQGETFTPFAQPFKGRTEWPGCMMFDPTGKSDRLIIALVYGSPILVGSREGATWKVLDKKSGHVDWFATDWTDPDNKFVITMKHEAGGLLLRSLDGGASFADVSKNFSAGWIFDGKTAVATQAKSKEVPEPKLVRTTDAGVTWTPVADYVGPALPKWLDGRLYWVTDKALIATSDQGATWNKISDLKDGRFGPIAGKKPGHYFIATKTNILETSDDGKTWSAPIALPPTFNQWSGMSWLDYDPQGDVLYAVKMSSELYRWKR